MSRLAWFHSLDDDAARAALLRCCGSPAWAARMAAARPFTDVASLEGAADAIWWGLSREDWLEALAAHPRIGSARDVAKKEGQERAWAEGEQAGARAAGSDVLASLADANAAYEEKFGHVYVVCATGKSADEMLALCRARLANDPETELRIAAEEQRKITRIRLAKLLAADDGLPREAPKGETMHAKASITTHVLDTARGRPARDVPVVLERKDGEVFREIGRGTTDADGRLKALVPEGAFVAGTWRITFDVAAYQSGEGFFPEVSIVFVVRDASQHHHVPLLLSPFGYSTYRGS